MTEDINMDWHRSQRTGIDEAVLCTGKSVTQLQVILQLAEERQQALLFTRLDTAHYRTLGVTRGKLDYDAISSTAMFLPANFHMPQSPSCSVAVVTAGTSDAAVAREAVRTLAFHGITATQVHDAGVAGLWRIEAHLPLLNEQQIIICVAGMDAALPTVLAGLVPALIIAVPTSTGYGVARGGRTALHALLCSCAQGIVVVNIDNGFGAACAALRAARAMAKHGQTRNP